VSLKVGVLMGGASEERDVSISSGQAIIKACNEIGYMVSEFLFKNNYKKFAGMLQEQDLIFNALHGGMGENGEVQKWMDKINVKYTGSGATSSSLCMNKAESKSIAKASGIATPKWQLIKKKQDIVKIKPPLIVKPNDQGSTVGLSVVNNKSEMADAIKKAFQFGENIIIEEFINGREITIPIIDSSPYPIVEISPLKPLYDYECKYTPGMSKYHCPAKLEDMVVKRIESNTMVLFDKLGCSIYARADYILDRHGIPYFLEMNTLPGMTSTSLVPKSANAKGLNFNELISTIIKLSL
tara:strand:+ start:1068 stop:1958 length:891 start_codon:yes stop_codon:yes gene_type:complete